MTLIIERIISSFLIITGLSYLFQGLVWKDLVKELLTKPVWLMMWSLLFLPWGLVVIFTHNLWVANWTVIITIIGWLITAKCVLYLVIPSWSNFVKNWSDDFLQRYIQIAGGIETILGGGLLFLSFAS